MQQLSAFLRTGALVFGGGHVVMPLLEHSLVPQGWIGLDQFFVGYGAAQAVPGPMFSFAAFIGCDLQDGLHGLAGALMALTPLFLPSFLLIGGVNDRRRSNRAGFRSRLTFRSLLQQFPPIRGLLVCDDTAVRQISRLSSAPFVGAPQETSHTPWT